MKRYIYTIIISLVTIACDDYLETPPMDRLNSDGFYQTPAQSEQGVMGVYTDLRYLSDNEFWYLSELRSDNLWVQTQPDGYREWSELNTFRAAYDLPMFNTVWNRWYKLIYDANIALAKIPSCDFGTRETFKNQLLGEVHFLRGWAYFELARLFANIPIIDVPMSPKEAANVPQSTVREVYDKIVLPDLKEAKRLLPLNEDMIDIRNQRVAGTRADKIAVQAMLGRVYMTMAGFPLNDASAKALAEVELKAVIDYSEANTNKYWAPDSTEWKKQWMAEYNNKYSIFAIQHRSGGTGNPSITSTGLMVPPSYTAMSFLSTNRGFIWIEKSLRYEFDKTYENNRRDARGEGQSILSGYDAEPNAGTIWATPYPIQSDTIHLSNGSIKNTYINSMLYKYVNSKHRRAELGLTDDIETAMKDVYDWPINYAVIRFEDVLLMYAEILVSKNDVSGAMDIVNRIRTRMGCDAEIASNATHAMELIKRERRIEFLGEGIRWFDLIRWNEWQAAHILRINRYNNPAGTDLNYFNNGRYLCPIPMNQQDVKPGFYKQNEGY